GYAIYFHNFSTFEGKRGLYLEDIFIRPNHRGKGIGKALLKHLARLALERGCARFEWVVLDWNTPAIEFYQGLGASVLEDWKVCRMERESIEQLACGED
ncbi:MAG: GNAT family N-acetyltransferase, partial [Verrucomicrobiota bacterium]